MRALRVVKGRRNVRSCRTPSALDPPDAIGIRVGEEFLYWLKLRLRRRKARGPAAGTPRCGRRWRAVLAHPAAPTLSRTQGGARPVEATSIGRLDAPSLRQRRLDEGSPRSRRFGRAPWRTAAHLERDLPTTARPVGSVKRLLRGTFSSGPVMVDAQTRVAGGGTRVTHRFAHLFRAEVTSSAGRRWQRTRPRTRSAPRTFAQTASASNSAGHKQVVGGSSPPASSLTCGYVARVALLLASSTGRRGPRAPGPSGGKAPAMLRSSLVVSCGFRAAWPFRVARTGGRRRDCLLNSATT